MFYHLSDWFDVGDLQDEGIAGIDGNSGSLEVELPRGLTWCYNHDAHHRNHVTLNPLQEDEYLLHFPGDFALPGSTNLATQQRGEGGIRTSVTHRNLCSWPLQPLCWWQSCLFHVFFGSHSWHLMTSHGVSWYPVISCVMDLARARGRRNRRCPAGRAGTARCDNKLRKAANRPWWPAGLGPPLRLRGC